MSDKWIFKEHLYWLGMNEDIYECPTCHEEMMIFSDDDVNKYTNCKKCGVELHGAYRDYKNGEHIHHVHDGYKHKTSEMPRPNYAHSHNLPNHTHSNIISLQGEIAKKEKSMPHEVAELMCIKCGKRWIGVYPEKCLLKDIECTCGEVGYVIKTGQTLEVEE